MRIVAIEEHAAVPELWQATGRIFPPPLVEMFEDMGDRRLADMDAHGIDVQVLSQHVPRNAPDRALAIKAATAFNEAAAAAAAAHPGRFAAFAALPATDAPGDAVAELERAVEQLGCVGTLCGTSTPSGFLSVTHAPLAGLARYR